MIIGMDFGTTNSGLALYDGQAVQLLPVDPSNEITPHVLRTMLYITRGQQYYVGREAVDVYYEQNQGRPIKLKREYVGEISLTFAELGTFWRDIYIWIDELEPGRLFRSIKSHLQDTDYVGTQVWSRFYKLEDIVAAFLRIAKKRAERFLDTEVEEIVLGRPVKFGDDAQGDRVAEERLARAALLAGYKHVYFELEPIAAALSYQQTIAFPQKVLVFDFGGGTLDLTVMEISPSGHRQVLSTGGVRIAGDVFDQRIIRTRLAKRLGEQITYGPKALNMPAYIFEELCEWQSLLLLNRPDVLDLLSGVESEASDPAQINALRSLISNNYGLLMFDRVEQGKIELSSQRKTVIELKGQGLSIEEPLTRGEFEQIIWADARQIAACIDETMEAAGVEHEQIDAVVRTGGSSLIPLFQRLLAARFGRDKIQPVDEFSSVTAGLSIAAYLQSEGEADLRSYSTEILPPPEPEPSREEEDIGQAFKSRGW
jgi:hypothetical chaperone protein